MKRAAILLLVWTLACALPLSAYAAQTPATNNTSLSAEYSRLPADLQSFPEDFYIHTDIISMPNGQALFIDPDQQHIYMADTKTSTEQWNQSYDHIYSCKMMPGSSKIVLIVRNQQQLQKIVLSTSGKTLSQFSYPDAMLKWLSRSPSAQIGWSAPDKSGQKEKVAIQSGDRIYIYQSPWKKPIQTFTSPTRQNHLYDKVISTRVDYQGNDLVIAYQADRLMQTQSVFELFHTSKATSKPHIIQTPWNLKAQLKLENGEAVIYTSNILRNPLGLNAEVPHPIYARYNVKTGKLLAEVTRTLGDQNNKWETDYSQGQLFLADKAAGMMYLYDSSGKKIWETAEPSQRITYRFIKYEQGMLYLLAENSNREFTIAKVPVVM